MKFKKLHIFGFGKLQELCLEFSPCINVLLAPNDSGKSTIQQALFALLYPFGEPQGELRLLRERYRPWSGTRYGGFLEISLKDGDYRIEKLFQDTPRNDKVTVYQIKEYGIEEVKVPSHKRYGYLTGDFFCGISREVFENISVVRQLEIFNILHRDILNDYIRGLILQGKQQSNLSTALKKLNACLREIGEPERQGRTKIAGQLMRQLKDIEAKKEKWKNVRNQWIISLKKEKQLRKDEIVLEPKLKDLDKKINELENRIAASYNWIKKRLNDFPSELKELKEEECKKLRLLEEKFLKLNPLLSKLKEQLIELARKLKFLKIALFLSTLAASFCLLFSIFNLKIFLIPALIFILLSSFIFLSLKQKKERINNLKIENTALKDKIKKEFITFFGSEIDDNFEKHYQGLLKKWDVSSLASLYENWCSYQDLISLKEEIEQLEIPLEAEIQDIKDTGDIRAKLRYYRNLKDDFHKLELKLSRVKNEVKAQEHFLRSLKDIMGDEDPATLYHEYEEKEKELAQINCYRSALEMAIKFLTEAGEKLYSKAAPYLKEFLNEWLPKFSEEYEYVEVDESLNIKVKLKGCPNIVGADYLGKGMQTVLYLMLRIAILKMMATHRGEVVPLILDETFNILDDFGPKRIAKIMELLSQIVKSVELQVIYFTCQYYSQYFLFKESLKDFFEVQELEFHDFKHLLFT